MRSLFITNRLQAHFDTGIISIFLGLTFHRMLDQLYDEQNNCIWSYDNLKADIFDAITRTMMCNAVLYLSEYFTKKVYNIPIAKSTLNIYL